MDVAGTAPGSNEPGSRQREHAPALDSRAADLNWMLAPLRALPGAVIEPLGEPGELCELTLEMELDSRAPHIDFVAQLLTLIRRVLNTGGVRTPLWIVRNIEQLAAQAGSRR